MARVLIDYAPREAFKPLHRRKTRWACVVAHRRAGKTVACVNELIKAALTDARTGQLYAYVAPFYTQAKGVAWDYLKDFSRPVPDIKINEAELRIDYPNGNRIQLFGADNADRMRGLAFSGLVADEFGDWKPSVWGYVIRPALADRNGWAVIIGTPKGRNQFCDVYESACRSEEWLALTIKASESGLLPDHEIASLRRELSEDAFRQEMECDFEAALPGAYYGRELRELAEAGRIRSGIFDPDYKVSTAWDIGRSDDTSIWWYQIIAREIRIIDFHSSNLHDVAFYASQIMGQHVKLDFINDKIVVSVGNPCEGAEHRQAYNYDRHWLPHDARAKTLAASRSVIEQLAAVFGWTACGIVPDIGLQDGIQAVRLMLPRVFFDLRCKDGINALSQYQRVYDEDLKAFRDNPRHDWTSHPADAFRMLAVAWRNEAKDTKPVEKPILGISVPQTADTLDQLWASAPKPSGRI